MSRQELKALAKQQLGGGIFTEAWLMAALACFIVSAISAFAGTVGVGIGAIIVTGPLYYGLCYVFLKQSRDSAEMNMGDLFKGFTDDFVGTFLIGLISGLVVALCSLILVIPGIIATYEYSMAFYIKIDHPDYTWKECMRASREMMNGYKMTLFMQDLSFIGWMFVGTLCFGIGTLFVMPYMQATRAHFYNSLISWNNPYVNA